MSTDSTELTFVRCPSCRSLVPAAQKRCRMCGAVLDTNGQTEEEQTAQKKPGRVKQRTISQPGGDLAAIVSQIRKEEEAAKAAPAPEEEKVEESQEEQEQSYSATEAVSDADPLGGFIGAEEPAEADLSEPTDEDEDLDALWDDEEDDDALGLDAAAEDEEDDLASDDDDDDESADEFLAAEAVEKAPEPVAIPEEEPAPFVAEPEPEAKPAPRKPGFIIETGVPRPGQRSGLSFGKPKEQPAPMPKEEKPMPLREVPAAPAAEPMRLKQEPRPQPTAKPQFQPRQAPEPVAQPAPVIRAVPQAVAPVAKAMHGRLFGWLVSYQNPDGEALELREGRFFVSRSGLKGNDLILDDPSVATPHALLTVSQEKGLVVQDLMSERGVFVRRRGGGSYLKEELFQVQHGDWVRFGDVEFLISLIAHVGEQ